MKKLILILSIVLPMKVFAETKIYQCGEHCTATLTDDGVMSISGTGNMDNYNWNTAPWYDVMASIKKLVVSEGITSLGQYSFRGAPLSDVTLPKGLTEIAHSALANTGITSVSLPDSLTTIGYGAFSQSGLTSITLPDSLTSLSQRIFLGTKIENIIIPDGVTRIQWQAFGGASNLSDIFIPDTVTQIDSEALGSSTGTIYCASLALCQSKGADDDRIQTYTKYDNGVYALTDAQGNVLKDEQNNPIYWASAEDMLKGAGASCGSQEACEAKIAQYMDEKAEAMMGGSLCATKKGCLKLLNMVADQTVVCKNGQKNSIANCKAYANERGIAFNNPDDIHNKDGSITLLDENGRVVGFKKKRIYTVDEAELLSKEVGNKFKLKYK